MVEELTESVAAAERKAARRRAKSETLRAHALHFQADRLDVLLRAARSGATDSGFSDTPGHVYLFLDPTRSRLQHILYAYEQKGRFIVPIGNITYICDSLIEAEARLCDWAEQSGMIRTPQPVLVFGSADPCTA
jgi:hypothetical protein